LKKEDEKNNVKEEEEETSGAFRTVDTFFLSSFSFRKLERSVREKKAPHRGEGV
jgi:hypothetical protein